MRKLQNRLIEWKIKNIKQRQFILILSFVIGIVSGLAAIILKNAIHFTHELMTGLAQGEYERILYVLLPITGILLTIFFIRYIIKDDIGHGVSKILYSISQRNGLIKGHNTFSSMVASILTIGFGGSVGAEAPIVLTGSALGSNIARFFRLNRRTIALLIGCGAAGAISGIFKAPIAGMIFTLEVLMLDLTMASIVPLLISAATSASMAYFFMGQGFVLTHENEFPFELSNIPYYLFLGIFCGLISVYFTRATMFIESVFDLFKNAYNKWLVGGLILGILVFIFPPLYGEGYDILNLIINGQANEILNNTIFESEKDEALVLILFVFLLMAFKVVAMSSTTGSGGIGGIFAPTLFMGGITGLFVTRLADYLNISKLPESNFAVAGMAGMMAGVMHAPLTAIFLIVELTGGYALFIPIMITSTLAYLTIMYFEPHSIYTKRLAHRGELLTLHKDRTVLTLLKLEDIIETDLKIVYPDDSLAKLVKIVSTSKRNIFPVVKRDQTLVGVVILNEIRNIIFKQELYEKLTVQDVLVMPPDTVEIDDTMNRVMQKFEKTGAWNLPVTRKGKYVGFVSKSKIFNAYRNILLSHSDE